MSQLVRLLAVTWWLQLKMRSRSAFDGLLSLLWPLFFATTVFLMYRSSLVESQAVASAAVGASVMGIWSATSTTSASALQMERRQGTLEMLVAAPKPFALLVMPLTFSMATIGAYSMGTTLLWGHFVFGIDIAIRRPLMFAVSVLFTVIAIAMLGFIVALSSVRYRAAWAVGSALEIPIWLVCGFLVPISALPAWMRPLSWLLAPTWGMAGIRASMEGQDALPYLGVCAAIILVYGYVGTVLARLLLKSARVQATLAVS